MESSRFRSAVSPVVAVILMVAITVILSAVIGTFVLDIGQSTADSANQQDMGVSTSLSNGQYTATIITGSADEVKLLINGTEVDNISNADAGDTLTANISSGDRITVVTVNDGERTVTLTQTVSTASNSTTQSSVTAPTAGLVAHWLFDDDTTPGTAIDSENSHNGTIFGSDFNTSTSRGTVLEHHTNDTIDIGSSDGYQLGFTGSFTVSAWFKTGVGADGSGHAIYLRAEETGQDQNPRVTVYNGSVYFNVGNESTNSVAQISSDTMVADGTWHQVVAVFNDSGDSMSLYIDGTLENSTTTTVTPRKYSETPTIGFYDGYHGNKSYWDGHIDDLRVYNRSLNASEANDLYEATK